ncbi:cell division protein FtsW [Amphibacillus marinus]|uniref:Probable peptidoglycan glycosyltransferase FtsW n=1 Tax=Amphibacillus marinus TaxID=872970 RepID=A0A1H8QBE9_9BACI|nr:putative lipid II flippase FtsW [Amphibacillus marinus]SEO51555.1 cell division protein FtsW [Amphibacillus marinus]
MKDRLKRFDYSLIITVLAMCIFGLVMVYSTSYTRGTLLHENGSYYFNRQLIFFIMGLVLCTVMAFFSLKSLGKLSPFLVLLSIILLGLVLVPQIGIVRNSARRWIEIGPIAFQPSEIVKTFMIIYFAHIYAKKQAYLDHFAKGVLPPLFILGIIFIMILGQPDLGTAVHILIICGFIVVFSGVRFVHIFMLGLIAVSGIGFFAISQPYRLQRLTSFMDFDPSESYQLVNSYVSIATSGLFGNGLGNSVQKLGYLPEAQTDFIMAVVVEELGIFGVLFIIGGYLFILYRGVQISKQVDAVYLKLLALGVTVQIIIQAVINLGAISGMLPITGIPLPFISYGGTSLVFTLLSVGILINVSGRRSID